MGIFCDFYDNSNGLPTSEANAIAQTRNGFIWIGGYSGLIRYDGNDSYRFEASEGITSVMSLYVDKEDRLWIGTNDKGAVLYDNGEFRFFGKAEGLRSLSVRAIVEDASGMVYGSTIDSCFFSMDNLMVTYFYDGKELGIGEVSLSVRTYRY